MRSLFLIVLLSVMPLAMAYDSPPPVSTQQASPEFSSFTIPSGSALHVVLQSPVDTGVNQAGDPIEAAVAQNVYLGNRLLISKDDRLRGRIIELLTPIQGRNAILEIRFTDLILSNGEVLPINAYVRTERADHKWGGEVTPGTKIKTTTHKVWYLGQYKQATLVGPRRMGANIQFAPGEYWTIVLEQPITLVKPVEGEVDL